MTAFAVLQALMSLEKNNSFDQCSATKISLPLSSVRAGSELPGCVQPLLHERGIAKCLKLHVFPLQRIRRLALMISSGFLPCRTCPRVSIAYPSSSKCHKTFPLFKYSIQINYYSCSHHILDHIIYHTPGVL